LPSNSGSGVGLLGAVTSAATMKSSPPWTTRKLFPKYLTAATRRPKHSPQTYRSPTAGSQRAPHSITPLL